ncbi:hypothetical protein [Bradyrhizobium sp. Ash2021]|uniref:HoxN/HupN/NixA family nickel/cobalt transporter n=1 Tax=Bradyrhizobium sp. Ash2021 TaxID=2954771 RepID=UPI002815C93B|nr:hypothetical protein [Bradyrhizobium sp. Ash2021]
MGGWQRGLSAVVAVGLRPCSGAIIVLIFALAQDLFWTGAGSTLAMGLGTAVTVAAIAPLVVGARRTASRIAKARSGIGMLIMRAVEIGAAIREPRSRSCRKAQPRRQENSARTRGRSRRPLPGISGVFHSALLARYW